MSLNLREWIEKAAQLVLGVTMGNSFLGIDLTKLSPQTSDKPVPAKKLFHLLAAGRSGNAQED
jgi:hypothetical protein